MAGLEQESIVTQFTVFPNPTSGKVKIQYTLKENSKISVEINDINGKMVTSMTLGEVSSGEHLIESDLSSESAGIYFVKLKTNQGYKILKIIRK